MKEADFAAADKAIGKGATIKEVWQSYAKSAAKAYSYEYFSTLYRVWCGEQRKMREPASALTGGPAQSIPDYTANEDHAAECYWQDKLDPRSAIHALSGLRCSLAVKNGELITYDGAEERRFPKAVHGLAAVVFLDIGGSITLPAIHWCHAQGVGIYTLGRHAELVSVMNAAALPQGKSGESSVLALRRWQWQRRSWSRRRNASSATASCRR